MSNAYINTYTQIHIHFVFAVKFRKALIDQTWNEELHKYITGIIQNKNHKMLVTNTMPDHLHMLVGFRPHDSMSEVMKVVKEGSQDWINDNIINLNGKTALVHSHIPKVKFPVLLNIF